MPSFLSSRSEFSRHIATLLTGTSISQFIPILISPILTRLYSPADFGIFALFLVLSTIFGSVANLRYDMAIVLPEKEKDALSIAAFSIAIAFGIGCMVLVIIILFHTYIIVILNEPDLELWIYFIPLMIVLTGLYNVLNHINIRNKQFQIIASTSIIRSVVLALVQLIIGLFRVGVSGLIVGLLVSNTIAYLNMLKTTWSNVIDLQELSISNLKQQAYRYKKFPIYSAPGIFLNVTSQHISSVFISALFSVTTLGQYYLVQRMLSVPTTLLGTSISQVYYQEASSAKNISGSIKDVFYNYLFRLLLFGFILFGPLIFFVEDIFALVFGEEWRIAGEYAKILLPMFFIRFVTSPLTLTLMLFEKQLEFLLINLFLLITMISIFLITRVFGLSIMEYLYLLSMLLFIIYLVLLFYVRHIALGNA